ncbi:hypothetical protein M569_02847, partial [Genlisea aurea]
MQEGLLRQQAALGAIADATARRLQQTNGVARDLSRAQEGWRQTVEGNLNQFAGRVQEALRETVQQERGQAQARILALEAENQHILQEVEAYRAHVEEMARREAVAQEARAQQQREAAGLAANLQQVAQQVAGLQGAVAQRLTEVDTAAANRAQGVEAVVAQQLEVQSHTLGAITRVLEGLERRLGELERRPTVPAGGGAEVHPRPPMYASEEVESVPGPAGEGGRPRAASTDPLPPFAPRPQPEIALQPFPHSQGGYQESAFESERPPLRRADFQEDARAPSEAGGTHFTARVNALGQGGVVEPLALEALRGMPVQRFSGNRRDFAAWREKWEDFYHLLVAAQGDVHPHILFQFLGNWLDEASAVELKARSRGNPSLTYDEFFADLCRQWSSDFSRGRIGAWKKVRLEVAGGRTTLSAWRAYWARLQQTLQEAEQPHDEEVREHLLRILPEGLQSMVVREEVQARRKQRWVRVRCPDGVPTHNVLSELQARRMVPADLEDDEVQWKGRQLMINVRTLAEQMRTLRYDGAELEQSHGRVRITDWEANFSPEQIRQLVHDKLEVEEVVQDYRNAGQRPEERPQGKGRRPWDGSNSRWPNQVRQVDAETPYTVAPVGE